MAADYDGSPSTMGLRQLTWMVHGTYLSPYMGMSEWVLRGNMLTFAGHGSFGQERCEDVGMDYWKGSEDCICRLCKILYLIAYL